MAVYFAKQKDDRIKIYEAAEKWKNKCLLSDLSLIWEDEHVWTEENMERFKSIFVKNPDVSGENFDSKLKKQLEGEEKGVYKLAIEIMFIYYMFPYKGSISYRTKLDKLEMIASWKGIDLNRFLPVFEALEHGLGATGTYYNTSKYHEITFLFMVAEDIKSQPIDKRRRMLSDEIELKENAERVRKQVGKRVQMFHIFLHFLLPDKFERIASWGHKKKIANTFSNLVEDSSIQDVDQKIYIIREKLEDQYNTSEDFDFYKMTDIEEQWRDTPKHEKKQPPEDKRQPNQKVEEGKVAIPSVDFDLNISQGNLVFENFELLIDQITTAIRNGKHIILTGPPGTGKSKLAHVICEMFKVESNMVTASSNWSTYETIGGYRPDKEGNLYFSEGIFLESVKNRETNNPENKWVIVDEINRADIDKAFGSLFSVLTGDEVALPFQSEEGKPIKIIPQKGMTAVNPDFHSYIIPNDWRIIATMNTIDKASLYEMSYAFMRRFAFIPVTIPTNIDSTLLEQYLEVWGMDTYPNTDILTSIWKLINNYRKIGPAIVEDIAKHTEDNDDFTSAVILYVLPQFEGLPIQSIEEFVERLSKDTDALINYDYLNSFIDDFFHVGAY